LIITDGKKQYAVGILWTFHCTYI